MFMEFYRFVNSKDIREYLQSINYTFTPIEAAWLFWKSMLTTLEEKHRAWEYIIGNMQDCCIQERLNTVPQPSLHHVLQELMRLEYYRGKLTGHEQVLYTISKELKTRNKPSVLISKPNNMQLKSKVHLDE